MSKEVVVDFSEGAYQALQRLSEVKSKTMSDTLRDCIALEKFFQDHLDQGARILVERPSGRVDQVIWR